jgi:hypothetical protein
MPEFYQGVLAVFKRLNLAILIIEDSDGCTSCPILNSHPIYSLADFDLVCHFGLRCHSTRNSQTVVARQGLLRSPLKPHFPRRSKYQFWPHTPAVSAAPSIDQSTDGSREEL